MLGKIPKRGLDNGMGDKKFKRGLGELNWRVEIFNTFDNYCGMMDDIDEINESKKTKYKKDRVMRRLHAICTDTSQRNPSLVTNTFRISGQ